MGLAHLLTLKSIPWESKSCLVAISEEARARQVVVVDSCRTATLDPIEKGSSSTRSRKKCQNRYGEVSESVSCSSLLLLNSFLVIDDIVSSSAASPEGRKESRTTGTLEQEQGIPHEVHCSRERSRAAWKIIEEYLIPLVDKEQYKIFNRCRLHPDNDMYRDQEEHKNQLEYNEWQCGFCKKTFYEEKYLYKHFDSRHFDSLKTSHSRCLGDICGALHCDLMMDSIPRKIKCNPAAAAKNKHLCEMSDTLVLHSFPLSLSHQSDDSVQSLADSYFPAKRGPSALRLHEFFLRQFCDSHTCLGGHKPFPKEGKGNKSGYSRAEAPLNKCTKEEAFIVDYA